MTKSLHQNTVMNKDLNSCSIGKPAVFKQRWYRWIRSRQCWLYLVLEARPSIYLMTSYRGSR